MQYARLAGDGRSEVLQTYHEAERMLRRVGLPERGLSQTITEYTGDVEARLGESASDLEWLRKAAWSAAYDSSSFDSTIVQESKSHVERLKVIIKSKQREFED